MANKHRTYDAWEPPRESLVVEAGKFEAGAHQTGRVDGWVLGATHHGRCERLLFDSQNLMITSGSLLLVRPRVPQSWRVPDDCRGGWHGIWAVFEPRAHWLDRLQWPQSPKGYSRLTPEPSTFRKILSLYRRAHTAIRSASPIRTELAMLALEEVILLAHADYERRAQALDDRVERALQHITAHLAEPMTLQTLADACHTSRARLAAVFHQQVGLPPMKFVERKRMERASELLRMTTDSVKSIAAQVGYDDPRHFTKRFKLLRGQTPSDVRAAIGK